jgi:hypothetical protein
MTRRWVDSCRHCGEEHEERNGRAWLRWYKEHLRACAAFLERMQLAVRRATR